MKQLCSVTFLLLLGACIPPQTPTLYTTPTPAPTITNTPTPKQTEGGISGKVIDSNSGFPVAAANVSTDPPTSSVTADAGGEYSISYMPSGNYTVTASKFGYKSASVKVAVAASRITTADLHLAPAWTHIPINPTVESVLPIGLVAYYPFEGNADDASGNNHHGTIHGAIWTDGKVGKALQFDGVDDYVEVGSLPGGHRLTMAAWMKSEATSGWRYIVGNHPWGGGSFLALNASENEIRFSLDLDGEKYIDTMQVNPRDGKWHHVVGVYDGSTARIYFDGALNNSRSGLSGVQPGFSAAIGKELFGGSNYFDGIIDQVAIYDIALSANEIRRLYEGAPPNVP